MVHTIFDFTSDLFTSYNDNLDVMAIHIDFKKAFDTVNRIIVVMGHSHYGPVVMVHMVVIMVHLGKSLWSS